MSIVVQSSSSTAWASATSVVITKPSGLIVGDLLVAIIPYQDGGITVSAPGGWTTITATTDGNLGIAKFWKLATSTETAATNFTFTITGGTIQTAGGLLRIDGHSFGNPIWTSAGDGVVSNTPTPYFANTITPAVANSLLIMAVVCIQGQGNQSSYAVVTSNPTWTEIFDFNTASNGGMSFSLATATRSQTTATGNSSVSSTVGATADWTGIIIAVTPSKDFSIAESTTLSDTTLSNITLLTNDSITLSDLTDIDTNNIINQTKNSSTWLNQDKN